MQHQKKDTQHFPQVSNEISATDMFTVKKLLSLTVVVQTISHHELQLLCRQSPGFQGQQSLSCHLTKISIVELLMNIIEDCLIVLYCTIF